MLTLATILLVAALVVFVLAAIQVAVGRVNLLAAGLALYLLSLLITKLAG